ncbi:MAG: hypothetical protein GX435_08220, partial [Exilispira sp.]|nr:hypothetical protein [Exilispira sp.]
LSAYLQTLLKDMKNIIDLNNKDQNINKDINKKSIMEKLFSSYHSLLLYFESSITAKKDACATYTEVARYISSMNFQNAELIQEAIKNKLESLQKTQTTALVNDILNYASEICDQLNFGNSYAIDTLDKLKNANLSLLRLNADGINKTNALIDAYKKYAEQQEKTEEDKIEKENLKSIYLNLLNELINEIVNYDENAELTEPQSNLLNFINSLLESVDIDKGYELVISFISSCIYNDLEKMVTISVENDQKKEIVDLPTRIAYLNDEQMQMLLRKMGCEVSKNDAGEIIIAEQCFSYIHGKVKDIYSAFIKKSINEQKNIYIDACINALNVKDFNQMINSMNDVSKYRYSLIFMQIFLGGGIFEKQWENITLSNSLTNLDDCPENARNFSNEIYRKEKESYSNVTNNENLKTENLTTDESSPVTIFDYMKRLREKSYNDYYTFIDIYNEFKSFDKEMALLFGNDSGRQARHIANCRQMLGNYSFGSSTYTNAQLQQAKDIIGKLSRLTQYSEWKSGINNNAAIDDLSIDDLSEKAGLNLDELATLDTTSLTMAIAYMFGNASTCSSNPLLSGYYQQIETMAIQNAVTYVYLKEKNEIVTVDGSIDIEKFYEKLNNYLKTTYIDEITEVRFKMSFSLTDFILTDDEAKSLKQKCSDTVNKIIDGIFANKKSAEIIEAIKQVTGIVGCIDDYTIASKISLQDWYNDKIRIKTTEDKNLLENTFNAFINDINNMKKDDSVNNISFTEIENAIDFEKAVQSYS